MKVGRRIGLAISIMVSVALVAPAAGLAAPNKFTRLATVGSSSSQPVAVARTPDGTLHLIYQTFAGRALDGLAAVAISAGGSAGPEVQALSGWQAGQPGLVTMPGGALEAFFGAISPGLISGVWGITSSNGGGSWSAPTSVLGGGPTEALAYGSDITAAVSGTTPVLSLPQAGNVVIQRGIGAGAPSSQLSAVFDGATTNADLAVDAATGEVVAGWPSIANKLTDYLQGASPTVGPPQLVPGQYRNTLSVAGRDTGAGVYAAYTNDGTHVRLFRYGGGSVAVGSLKGVSASVLGVATGLDGRLWVMWGDSDHGLAVTRSNKAVTRFEPIQHVDPKAFTLYRIFGDGRLGPLDLLVNEIPDSKSSPPPPGVFHARVLPLLSAVGSVIKIKGKQGQLLGFKLTVTVNDAGDPVQGATVSAMGQQSKTDKQGVAKLTLPASASGPLTVSITAPGYHPLQQQVSL